MSSSMPVVPAPTAAPARSGRAGAAGDRTQDALMVVLEAVRTTSGATRAVLLRSQDDQFIPVACHGLLLASEPIDEPALARLGMTSYPLVLAGRTEGLLLLHQRRSARGRPAHESRLRPLLDLAALALREARLADDSRKVLAEVRLQAALLNAVEHAVIAVDLDGMILYWNRIAEGLYGWSAAEMVGQQGFHLLVTDDMRARSAEIRTELLAGHSWSGEFLVRRRDGTNVPVLITDSLVRDSAGEPIGIIGVSVDITERKRDEEALRAGEERFRSIVETAHEGVWSIDADGLTTFVNQRLAELLGYQPQEMIGQPQTAFLDAEGRKLLATSQQRQDQLAAEQVDVKFTHKDRSVVWTHVITTGLTDGFGRPSGSVAMVADIKDRRQAETERSRLAAIVTSSLDAIYANTIDGTITDWNPSAEALFGYRLDEIVGRSALCLAPPDRRHEITEQLRRLHSGDRVERFQTVRVRKDGSRVDVAISLGPIRDVAGHITAAAVVVRDITVELDGARQRTELAREQAAHSEVESARRREAFLSNASRCLAASLDYKATLREMAPLAVPDFADYCRVYLLDEHDQPRPVALAQIDSIKDAFLHTVQIRHAHDPNASGGLAEVLRTGHSVLYAVIPDAECELRAFGLEHAPVLRSLGSHSAMIVPLAVRGRMLGGMSFVRSHSVDAYTSGDLLLAEDLGQRCAQAIDNAGLYQAAQHEIAQRREIEAERVQLLAQIERERATLAGLMDSMSDGLLVLDADLAMKYCNARAGELLGIDPALMLEHAVHMRKLYGEAHAAWSSWQDALSRVEERPQLDLDLPGPPVRQMQLRLFPVGAGPKAGGGIGILVQDVTAARELQRARDDLISMVSHELASPASNLVMCAELLGGISTEHTPAERQELLSTMVAEGHRLDGIIRDFLDIQRLENQGLRLQPRPADLRVLLEHAANVARQDTGHRLVVDMADALPLVHADPARVQQVLANLLSNARKYTPPGGEIRLRAQHVDGTVELSVVDNGLGIPADALPHVFERFYRVAGHERRGIQGTGLGLAIVKELVEAQGGRIGVESAGSGKGSRFWFSLPVLNPEASAPPTGRAYGGSSPEADVHAASAHSLRVLVVDDDRAVGTTLLRVLRLDGHSGASVLSGEEALARLEADRYDVVVSDLGLGGGMDGLHLAQLVRALRPEMRFVLSTGKTRVDQAEARAMGVDAFLHKPFRPRELLDLLSGFVSPAAGRVAA